MSAPPTHSVTTGPQRLLRTPVRWMRPPVPLVDNRGMIHPTWGRVFDQLAVQAYEGDMSTITRLVAPQSVGTTPAALYTAPTMTRVDKIVLNNTDTAAHTVQVYYVPKGQAPQASNQVWSGSIPAGTPIEPTEIEGHIIGPGDSIQITSDTAGVVTVTSTGVAL